MSGKHRKDLLRYRYIFRGGKVCPMLISTLCRMQAQLKTQVNIHTLQWSYLLWTKIGSDHVRQYKGRCINTPTYTSDIKNINGCLPLQKKPVTLGRSENTLHNCCVGPSHPWSAGKLHHEKEMMQKSAALRTYHTCFNYTYKRACYQDVHWDKQTQKVTALHLGWATHLRMYPMPNDYFKKGPHFHCHTQTC